jgi:hypothetical protein
VERLSASGGEQNVESEETKKKVSVHDVDLLTGVAATFTKSYAPRASRLASLAVALGILGGPRAACGDTPSLPVAERLHVTGDRCLDRAQMAAGVASWLGRGTMAAQLSIEVEEIDGGGRFVLRRDGAVLGQRTLLRADSSCAELRAALTLAIAVAIDATILDALGITTPAPAPPLLPAALPPPPPLPPATSTLPLPPSTSPPSPPPAPTVAWRDRPRLSASVEIGALLGLLPQPAFLVAPAVAYAPAPAFEVRLAGMFTSAGSAELLGGGASFRIAAARLDVCAVEPLGPIVVHTCLGALAGGLFASGFSYSRTYSPTSAWIAVAGRVDGRWLPERGRLGVTVALDGLFVPESRSFEVHDALGRTLASVPLPSAGLAITAGPVLTFR